jgi:hypothetical protein
MAAMSANTDGLEWLIGGREDRILWIDTVLPRLMEEMRAGYKRYAWEEWKSVDFSLARGRKLKSRSRVGTFYLAQLGTFHLAAT